MTTFTLRTDPREQSSMSRFVRSFSLSTLRSASRMTPADSRSQLLADAVRYADRRGYSAYPRRYTPHRTQCQRPLTRNVRRACIYASSLLTCQTLRMECAITKDRHARCGEPKGLQKSLNVLDYLKDRR